MIRVVIESPYAGNITANVDYARAAVKDSLQRGEAPIASHLLYTQEGILDDFDEIERHQGIQAGWAWIDSADILAFYVDRGVSRGMRGALDHANTLLDRPLIEVRSILNKKRIMLLCQHIEIIQQELDAAVHEVTGLFVSTTASYGSGPMLRKSPETPESLGQDLPRKDPSDPA